MNVFYIYGVSIVNTCICKSWLWIYSYYGKVSLKLFCCFSTKTCTYNTFMNDATYKTFSYFSPICSSYVSYSNLIFASKYEKRLDTGRSRRFNWCKSCPVFLCICSKVWKHILCCIISWKTWILKIHRIWAPFVVSNITFFQIKQTETVNVSVYFLNFSNHQVPPAGCICNWWIKVELLLYIFSIVSQMCYLEDDGRYIYRSLYDSSRSKENLFIFC